MVWLINGLFCKVLGMVPRHERIVSRILGERFAGTLTYIIGGLEILMVIWILSRFKSRWCAIVQIAVVATMNIIEFILAPDLLLFGRWNLVIALFFIFVVYVYEFRPHRRKSFPVIA
jgi:uncharacterized membrane protein YphA (DoxX/SURF4 family)